jgi:hypothetical protein
MLAHDDGRHYMLNCGLPDEAHSINRALASAMLNGDMYTAQVSIRAENPNMPWATCLTRSL